MRYLVSFLAMVLVVVILRGFFPILGEAAFSIGTVGIAWWFLLSLAIFYLFARMAKG
jgi:hypothetical protein